MSLRALSEDVQDQAAAIQHLYVQKLFQCSLLLGGKILIRDKQRKSCLLLGLHKLLGLPGADGDLLTVRQILLQKTTSTVNKNLTVPGHLLQEESRPGESSAHRPF